MREEALRWARWALSQTFPRRNYSPTWRQRAWADLVHLRWLLAYEGELKGLGVPADLSTLPGVENIRAYRRLREIENENEVGR